MLLCRSNIKEIDHPTITFLSSLTLPHVIRNLYFFSIRGAQEMEEDEWIVIVTVKLQKAHKSSPCGLCVVFRDF